MVTLDLIALKAGGVIAQSHPRLFSIRLRVPVGDPGLGTLLAGTVPEDEAFDLVEPIIKAYRRLADKNERLGQTIDRVGLNAFRREVCDGILT